MEISARFGLIVCNLLVCGVPLGARAQTAESVTYNFSGLALTDGAYPRSTLLRDANGNFFGTTQAGGIATGRASDGAGTVYELSPPQSGQSNWTETVLYRFGTKTVDGRLPNAALTADAHGNLFTTTSYALGFNKAPQAGTIVELSPPAPGQTAWSEQVLHIFGQSAADGASPYGKVFIDPSGNLYTTTFDGGAYSEGTVVKLTLTAAGKYREHVIYSFGGVPGDGRNPESSLSVGPHGSLIVTTTGGGQFYDGSVVMLRPSGTGEGLWQEQVVYSFKGKPDGASPMAALVADAAGNYYTTTSRGGASTNQFTAGTVVKLTPPRSGTGPWQESVMHSFGLVASDGCAPEAEVLVDKQGSVYTTASECGTTGGGTVLKFAPPTSGTAWPETILYTFVGGPNDGSSPFVGLTPDATGNLFTPTLYGGPNHDDYYYGTVAELTGTGYAP